MSWYLVLCDQRSVKKARRVKVIITIITATATINGSFSLLRALIFYACYKYKTTLTHTHDKSSQQARGFTA